MNRNSALYTVAFSAVVCVVFVFPLALANEMTKDRVEANKRFAERSAVLRALGVPYADAAEVDAAFQKEVQASASKAGELYRYVKDGRPRWAVRYIGNGLWGSISGVIAFDAEIERIVGLEIVSHLETPGLGGRIDEAWFKDQFKNEKIGPNGIKVRAGTGRGDKDPDNSEVDMITGATRTSEYIQAIVNKESADLRAVKSEGGLK